MIDEDLDKYEMFIRAQDLLGVHAASFPAGSRGAAQVTILGEVIETLDAQSALHTSSMSSVRQNATEKETARQELRAEMKAINVSARVREHEIPGFAAKFRMPPQCGDQKLITIARAFAVDAAAQAAEFAKSDMPADFVDTLNAKIEALEQAIERKNVNAEAQVAARTQIKEAIKRGMRAVGELDAIVRNKFRGDPVVLAEWERAVRIAPAKRKTVATESTSQPQ
ncbi:MAG: hypothetical protein WCF57_07580 [Pyrinomonadaceae bacterium]